MLRPQGPGVLSPSSVLRTAEQVRGEFLEDGGALDALVLMGSEGARLTDGSEG
jgi:hypothetical protein